MEKVKFKNLALGDVIRLSNSPYNCATIVRITDKEVTVFRPYVHTSDFSYGKNPTVIPYIGVEKWKAFRDDREVIRLEKGRDYK